MAAFFFFDSTLWAERDGVGETDVPRDFLSKRLGGEDEDVGEKLEACACELFIYLD